jgi:hypothetical protein
LGKSIAGVFSPRIGFLLQSGANVGGLAGKAALGTAGFASSIGKRVWSTGYPHVKTAALFSIGYDKFKDISNELETTTPDQAEVQARLSLNGFSQDLVDRISAGEGRINAFLREKLPRDPNKLQSKMTGAIEIPTRANSDWKPSETEIRKFSAYYRAATQPETVISDLAHRLLTPEAVETMEALYPDAMAGYRSVIKQRVNENKRAGKVYTERDAQQISLFLGQPMSMNYPPGSLARLQSNFKPTPRQEPTRGKGASLAMMKGTFSKRSENELQRIER